MCGLELWGHLKCSCSKAQPQQTPVLPELGSWGGSGTATKGWVPTHGDGETMEHPLPGWSVPCVRADPAGSPRVGDDTWYLPM